MDKLTFKITGIVMEKRINGYSYIDAICTQNDFTLSIKIQSSLTTKDYIKKELRREYFKLLNGSDNDIEVGDIL